MSIGGTDIGGCNGLKKRGLFDSAFDAITSAVDTATDVVEGVFDALTCTTKTLSKLRQFIQDEQFTEVKNIVTDLADHEEPKIDPPHDEDENEDDDEDNDNEDDDDEDEENEEVSAGSTGSLILGVHLNSLLTSDCHRTMTMRRMISQPQRQPSRPQLALPRSQLTRSLFSVSLPHSSPIAPLCRPRHAPLRQLRQRPVAPSVT